MRPQVAAVVATVARGISCHHEEHHVDLAIVVGVVLCEIHLVVNGVECGLENLACLVVAFKARVVEIDRSHNVKHRVELPHGVVVVVVANAAGASLESIIVIEASVVLGVTQLVVEVVRIVHQELLVVEVDEDNKASKEAVVNHWLSALRALLVASGTVEACLAGGGIAGDVLLERGHQLCLLGTACAWVMGHDSRCSQLITLVDGIFPCAVNVDDGVSINCGVEVIELVAHQLELQRGAIGLSHVDWCGVSRFCTRHDGGDKGHQ